MRPLHIFVAVCRISMHVMILLNDRLLLTDMILVAIYVSWDAVYDIGDFGDGGRNVIVGGEKCLLSKNL